MFGSQKNAPSQIAGKHLIINRMIKQNRDKHNGELSPRTHRAVEKSQIVLLDLAIGKSPASIQAQENESTESNLVRAFTNDIRDIVLKDPTEEDKKELKTAMWDLLAILPQRKVKQSDDHKHNVNIKVVPSPIATHPNFNPATSEADLRAWREYLDYLIQLKP